MTIYEKHIIFSGGGNWHRDHNHGTEKAGGIDWIGYQNEYFCSSLCNWSIHNSCNLQKLPGRRGKLFQVPIAFECSQEIDPRNLSIKHIHATGECTKFTDATYFTEVCTYLAGDVVACHTLST
jgi:hypothetical protein